MVEEAVPVVGAGDRVPRPVRDLGVGEDDARVPVALDPCRDHTYQSRLGESGLERDSWNHGCSLEVWFMTKSAITRMPSWCAWSTKRLEVVDDAVVGVDAEEVRDVVAAVAQRRGVHRQQPDAVDPEPLEVLELLGEPAQVARAVAVAVEEPADVDLVEDRALEPQRVGLEPVPGLCGRLGAGLLRPHFTEPASRPCDEVALEREEDGQRDRPAR